MKILYFLFISNILNQRLIGNYCGTIFNNHINMSFNNDSLNINANVLGKDVQCLNEYYLLESNNSIMLSQNISDCLNSYLTKFGACPCPPNIEYKPSEDKLLLSDEGIKLSRC